ncbi:hypothetical protein Salat_1193800 [Sesamum alatum]|uniref:Reverse transcriptase domain-containing protein n=1 Tax=Sesamum alatum TaxID=300844 RepID=A0AAE1YG37_9LAMI|nr:hypothetical protein Salat_1193800 [Sesamum alatum]
MSLSICQKLDFGELKTITISLQSADETVKYPVGILEDVSIRVGKFFSPAYFVILEMEEDTRIPIILGRSFLATAGAIIDVRDKALSLNVESEYVEFNLSNATKYPPFCESCCKIDDVDIVIKDVFVSFGLDDDLQCILVQDDPFEHENDQFTVLKRLLDSTDGAEDNRQKRRRNRTKHGQAMFRTTTMLSCFPNYVKAMSQHTDVLSKDSEIGKDKHKTTPQVELKPFLPLSGMNFLNPTQHIV